MCRLKTRKKKRYSFKNYKITFEKYETADNKVI